MAKIRSAFRLRFMGGTPDSCIDARLWPLRASWIPPGREKAVHALFDPAEARCAAGAGGFRRHQYVALGRSPAWGRRAAYGFCDVEVRQADGSVGLPKVWIGMTAA